MANIETPPFLLDSARVLMYAETGGKDSYTGRIAVFSGDTELGPVPCMAICEELTENRVLVMRCDIKWNVHAANFSSSVEDALRTAEREYSGISSRWKRYRDLTATENHEVEEMRVYLRKLAKDFPIDDA